MRHSSGSLRSLRYYDLPDCSLGLRLPLLARGGFQVGTLLIVGDASTALMSWSINSPIFPFRSSNGPVHILRAQLHARRYCTWSKRETFLRDYLPLDRLSSFRPQGDHVINVII